MSFRYLGDRVIFSHSGAVVSQFGPVVAAEDGGISPVIAPAGSVSFQVQGTATLGRPSQTQRVVNGCRCG
jgi:hypothetical protein